MSLLIILYICKLAESHFGLNGALMDVNNDLLDLILCYVKEQGNNVYCRMPATDVYTEEQIHHHIKILEKNGFLHPGKKVVTDGATLKQFIYDNTQKGTMVYTDESTFYKGLVDMGHESVTHSVGEWVNGMAHTNGLEGFWSRFKRAYHGTYHQLSRKYLNSYVEEFSGKHNIREMDTRAQMQHVVASMIGKRLKYKDLTS